jgi:hypothetical protein
MLLLKNVGYFKKFPTFHLGCQLRLEPERWVELSLFIGGGLS